jgi:hypothetical protein
MITLNQIQKLFPVINSAPHHRSPVASGYIPIAYYLENKSQLLRPGIRARFRGPRVKRGADCRLADATHVVLYFV